MAKWIEWNDAQIKAWADWVAARPAVIQEMIRKYNLQMDELYCLKTTGQKVTMASLNEDGTLTVNIDPEYNPDRFMLVPKKVFGINPADLEPADHDVPLVSGQEIWDQYYGANDADIQ